MPRLPFAALLAGLALGLAACTSPDSPSPQPESPSATAPADDPGGPGICDLDMLSFEAAPGDAAAGNRSVNVTARNLGASTCLLRGFPTVAMLRADGEAVRLNAEASTGTYFLQEQTVQPVLVPPSATAFFQIAYRSAATSGESCASIAQLVIATEIAEPDLTADPVTIPVEMAPCGESVRVSAFREGTYEPAEIEEVTPEPGL
jgi:hypothetical protein